ncbi:hypothetical protein E2542_SST28888 [Spatholobus suberectus]|nr:hypothetical protein E2542_SST28888 [Spatholobus suberectus]
MIAHLGIRVDSVILKEEAAITASSNLKTTQTRVSAYASGLEVAGALSEAKAINAQEEQESETCMSREGQHLLPLPGQESKHLGDQIPVRSFPLYKATLPPLSAFTPTPRKVGPRLTDLSSDH